MRKLADSIQQEGQTIAQERVAQWQPGYQKADEAYRVLLSVMEKKGVEFGQHEALVTTRDGLEETIATLGNSRTTLIQTEEEIREARSDLVNLYLKRDQDRVELAGRLKDQDADVRLQVISFGDRKDLAGRREQWFGGSGLQERDWSLLVEFVFSRSEGIPDRLLAICTGIQQDVETTKADGRALASPNPQSLS